MSYWKEEWQRAYNKTYERSLSQIIIRIFCGVVIISLTFYLGYYICENFHIDVKLIGFIEMGVTVSTIREMIKQDGSLHDLAVYFRNNVLKKKVVTYYTEIMTLQPRISELEAKNIELSNKINYLQKSSKVIENNCNKSERGISSYQKILLYYFLKHKVDYGASDWAGKTSRAMDLLGLSLSDKTLRTIREGIIELEKTRKK